MKPMRVARISATGANRLEALLASPGRIFLALYLFSLAANLAFGFVHAFRPGPLQLDADETEYWNIASDLMRGTIVLTARRTFGFPLVIAGVRSLWDNILFVQAVISAIYAFSPPLLSLIGRKLSGSGLAGALCGLALACWPPAIYYGCSLYSETLAAPIFLLALYVLPTGRRTEGLRTRRVWQAALLAGVLLGVATHVRPMYLLFMPFVPLIALIEEGELAPALRTFLLVLAGFLALILPWSVLQSARFHHPIIVTSNGGETLAGGLNPTLLTSGDFDAPTPGGRLTWAGPGKWLPLHQTGYLSPAEQRLPYDQQDKLLRERTLAWVMGHPLQAAYLEMCKLTYMWGIYPIARNGTGQMLCGNLPTIILLAVAVWGFVAAPGSRLRLVRLWALPIFVTGVAMISWGSWRFRQPGDAGLIAFCVICLVRYASARIAARQESGGDEAQLVREGAGSPR